MNKVQLIGRLTKDPEIKYTANQVANLSFTVACDRRFKDQNGQRQSDFINCVAWRQTAEFIAKYFNKGNKIALVGSIQTRTYEQNGVKHYVTEVIVDEAEFVESRQATQAAQAATAPQTIAPDINNAPAKAVQAVADLKETVDEVFADLPFEF